MEEDGFEDGSNWELSLALETSLQDEEGRNLSRVLEICKGRRLPSHLRAQVWELCLGVDEYVSKVPFGSDIFDLGEQDELRADCQKFVASLDNDEEEKVSILSDLESVLTSYSKSTQIHYDSSSGWIPLLSPLLTLKVSSGELYSAFRALNRDYIPRDVGNPSGLPYHIFRLLLLYHDPALCSLLDSKRVIPHNYAANWFRTLFAGSCSTESTLALWDVYFQFRDPFLMFHMVLALVLNAKEQVEEIRESEKEDIVKLLESLANNLKPEDVTDFIAISQHYATGSPQSYRNMFESALFGSESFLTFGGSGSTSPSRRVAMHSLCMPICAEELLNSIRLAKSIQLETNCNSELGIRFFVVDCRPASQYNAGHLPTAFHLDCGLMLQAPVSFSTAVQGLLLAQKEALLVGSPAGGEHLCFVGSGREEEDQYVHMVVSSFLQRATHKVSLLSGGYQALHELLCPDPDESLSDHDSSLCLECIANLTKEKSPSSSSHGVESSGTMSRTLGKLQGMSFRGLSNSISKSFKSKTVEMKEKLKEYIVSPSGGEEKHVNAADREKSKPYRNLASVFSLVDGQDDDEDGSLEETVSVGEKISLKEWLKQTEILGSYTCSEVMANGDHYAGYVAVTPTNIYMIRETDKKDEGEISVCRLLSSIIKITSKKKHPELITFKYGCSEGENVMITHCDRFYIPADAKEFVGLVKKQIDAHLGEDN